MLSLRCGRTRLTQSFRLSSSLPIYSRNFRLIRPEFRKLQKQQNFLPLTQKRTFHTNQILMSEPQPIYRKNYQVPSHLFNSVSLEFNLGDEFSTVLSKIEISPNPQSTNTSSLQLIGASPEEMLLNSISINGKELSSNEFTRTQEFLTILNPPKNTFSLEISVQIKPQLNTSLEGLYQSSGNFCTQCEAEGFRRITFFLDRPDVMSKYTVKIVAEKKKYPVLLSNGNLIKSGDLEHG